MTGGSCAVCVVGAHRTSPFTKLGQKKKCQNHNPADENHGGTDENLGLGDKYLVMSPILWEFIPLPPFSSEVGGKMTWVVAGIVAVVFLFVTARFWVPLGQEFMRWCCWDTVAWSHNRERLFS